MSLKAGLKLGGAPTIRGSAWTDSQVPTMAAKPAKATINIFNVEIFTEFLPKSPEGANYAHLLVCMAMREYSASALFRRNSKWEGQKGDAHVLEVLLDLLDKTGTRLGTTRKACSLGREELVEALHPLEALAVDPWKTADEA